MKIISVSIYTDKFEMIFHKSIDNMIKTEEALTISSFLNGLSNFARETFSHSLTRVDLETSWIDFIYSQEFIIVLVTEVPINLRERIVVVYDSIITEIEDFIKNLLHKKDFTLKDQSGIELLSTLLELKLSAIKKMKIRSITNSSDEMVNDDWQIDMGFVCEPSGVPIIYNSYGDSEVDPILVSSMLSMFSSFSNIEFNRKIRLIHLENIKLCFHYDEKLYILVVNSNTDLQKSIPDKIYVKVNKILEKLSIDVDDLYNSSANVTDDVLNEIMDLCILEYSI